MRLYYIAEAAGRRRYVCSALGVAAERWNEVIRHVRDWRLRLRDRYGIGPATELHPLVMVTRPQTAQDRAVGCATDSRRAGVEILRSGLRLIEHLGSEDGVDVINVCLPVMRQGRSAEVGLGRLFTRINTSVSTAGRHAFLTFDQEQEEDIARLYRRLRVHNPIPSRFQSWEDGAPTRDIPVDAIIGGPAFRSARTDHLLQLVRFVACALLLHEEAHGTGVGDDRMKGAFSILDRALNREASPRDTQGVVRR